jgi:CheY-like chemotaxis protein
MGQIRAQKPDVLITDFAMPVADGYELLRRVRRPSMEDGGGVPAVLLTAAAVEDHRTRARVAGFNAVMSKPIDIEAFCSLVAALAEQGRMQHQQRRSA